MMVGNSNLDLSINEMKSIIDMCPTAKKAIFSLYQPDENINIFFDIVVFMSMPTYEFMDVDDVIYIKNTLVFLYAELWRYDAGTGLLDKEKYYHELTINKEYIHEQLIKNKNYIESYIEYMDVKSLYTLYNNRISCINYYPNYAKNKTKEIFNTMVDKLSHYNNIIMLNLYLMMNYIILDLTLSEKFINSQKKFGIEG